MPAFGTGSLQVAGNAGPQKLPCRNEVFFDNLLVSAYSIQHKQDLIRSNVSTGRFNEILAALIDTRSLLRKTLHLDTAMHLILSRTQRVSGAPGAALYIAERGMIEYVAGTGIGLALIGTSFPESQCAFFTRARTRPAIEWGELDEPKVRERIGVGFELRAPVCSSGKVVGCLKLFSRIRQFSPEIVHVCELMTAFLGEIIEKQAPPVAQDVRQRPNESHLATNLALAGPRLVYRAARTTPMPVLRIEPKRNATPLNNQLLLRTVAPTGGQRPAGGGQSEEEQLPTIDELLGQLGVATEEGALLENPQPRPDQPPARDAVQITANTRSKLPVVPIEATKEASHVIGTTEPVAPLLADTDHPGKTRQAAIRKMRSNAAALVFPTFTLIFCVSLSITQTSVSSFFQALTFSSIIFSVIEIWRAGHGNR